MDLYSLETFITGLLTAFVIFLTYLLYRAAKLQFVASLTSAFQNQWHNPRAVLMRDYLHSEEFEDGFNNAIHEAYGIDIDYKEIDKLLDGPPKLQEIQKKIEKLPKKKREELLKELKKERAKCFKDFDSCLKDTNPKYRSDYENFPFSNYEALYEVLLSFDRIALFCDDRYMMDKCIRRYRPPIRDLSEILQAFIAIRIILREGKLKNYKNDYIHMIGLLFIDESIDEKFPLNARLFEVCKNGLIDREELTNKEQNEWHYIIEKRREYPYPKNNLKK